MGFGLKLMLRGLRSPKRPVLVEVLVISVRQIDCGYLRWTSVDIFQVFPVQLRFTEHFATISHTDIENG